MLPAFAAAQWVTDRVYLRVLKFFGVRRIVPPIDKTALGRTTMGEGL